MIRMQVRFTGKEYRAARREAPRLGISLAEFLRRSLLAMTPVDGTSSRCIDEVLYRQNN